MIVTGTLKAEDIKKGMISGFQRKEETVIKEITKLISKGQYSEANNKLSEQYEIIGEDIHLKVDPYTFSLLQSIIQLEFKK